MDKKLEQLEELLSNARSVVIDKTENTFNTVKGFNIKISTDLPTGENEISFDNVKNAVDIIYKVETITNKSKSDTEREFIEICKNSNIDPENKITISFLLS